LAVLASRFGSGYSIKRRFEMIADPTFNARKSWWAYAVVLAVAVLLPCLPVRGKPVPNAAEESKGSSLAVHLVDAVTGEPVLRGDVKLARTDDSRTSSGKFRRSYRDGTFTFTGLTPGKYSVRIEGTEWTSHPNEPKYFVQQQPSEVEMISGGDKEITVRLRPVPLTQEEIAERWPYVATGTVTDDQGKPVEGVDIYLYVGRGGTVEGWRGATTNAQGKYTMRYSGKGTGGVSRSNPPLLQEGSFSVFKDGYVERNLNRHTGIIVARQMPQEQEWDDYPYLPKDPSRVVLPNRPHRVDFVLLPEVVIEGQLVDSQGAPLSRKKLRMTGNSFGPKSEGVDVGRTDDQGRFRLERIPPGNSWWFAHRYDWRKEARSRPIAFERPGKYRAKLRLVADVTTGIVSLEIDGLTDPNGKDVP